MIYLSKYIDIYIAKFINLKCFKSNRFFSTTSLRKIKNYSLLSYYNHCLKTRNIYVNIVNKQFGPVKSFGYQFYYPY